MTFDITNLVLTSPKSRFLRVGKSFLMEQCFLLRSNDEQRGLRPGLRRSVFVSAIGRGQIRLTAVSSGGTVNALISPPGTELRPNASLASRFNIIPSSFGESGGSIPTLADSQKQASGVVQKTVKNGEKSKQFAGKRSTLFCTHSDGRDE